MDFKKEAIKSPMLELVTLSKERIDEINNFVKEVVAAKSVEKHHKKDNGQEEKRWTTGFCGEAALEQFLEEGHLTAIKQAEEVLKESKEFLSR